MDAKPLQQNDIGESPGSGPVAVREPSNISPVSSQHENPKCAVCFRGLDEIYKIKQRFIGSKRALNLETMRYERSGVQVFLCGTCDADVLKLRRALPNLSPNEILDKARLFRENNPIVAKPRKPMTAVEKVAQLRKQEQSRFCPSCGYLKVDNRCVHAQCPRNL